MSDSNSNNGNGTPAATTPKTRESRNNHKAAESNPITDTASAQRYADAVLEATKNDTSSTMINGSGFVFPAILNKQDIENLVRLSVSINNALASRVAAEGDEGTAARNALTLIGEYASSAGDLQEAAKMARAKAAVEAYERKTSGKAKATVR